MSDLPRSGHVSLSDPIRTVWGMNKHKILIYGEPLGDLLAGDEVLSSGLEPSSQSALERANVMSLVRAVQRAVAEILLESADAGGLVGIARPNRELRLDACARVLLEMRAVDRDPLTLHSHPRIAGRRAPVRADVNEKRAVEPVETDPTSSARSIDSDGLPPDLEEAV